MAQLRDTTINGNLNVTGSLNVADSTINGSTTFDDTVTFNGWNRERQGSYAHHATGLHTSSGYVKLAQITIGYTYANAPIQLKVIKRGNDPHIYTIRFLNSNNTDPDLSSFTSDKDECKGYLKKSAASTWDFYVYTSAYDDITVTDVTVPYYCHNLNRTVVTWKDEGVSDLPDGCIASVADTIYANRIETAQLSAGKTYNGTNSWGYITQDTTDGYLYPDTDGGYSLGKSDKRWYGIQLKNAPNVSSLVELKENIRPFTSALEEIDKTDVYNYNLKACIEREGEDITHTGFVIGDDYNISELLLGHGNDGIDLYNAIGVAFGGVKELHEKVKSQQAEIDLLKSEIQALKEKLA